MNHIITKAELSQLAKPQSGNDNDIDRCITEAEIHDIIPAIGAALYTQIASNQTTYNTILKGDVVFTTASGLSLMLQGLKRACAYYAESRFIRSANVQITKFGAVVKNDEYSTNTDAAKMNAESNYLKKCGDEIMEGVKTYLNIHQNDALYKDYFVRPTNVGRFDYIRCKTIGD